VASERAGSGIADRGHGEKTLQEGLLEFG